MRQDMKIKKAKLALVFFNKKTPECYNNHFLTTL